MKTTTIKFNYAESLKRNGKTITKGMVKEMPNVPATPIMTYIAATLGISFTMPFVIVFPFLLRLSA